MEVVTFMLSKPERVVSVYTGQSCLTIIQIISPFAKIEIQDVDADYFLHPCIVLADIHVLCDGFCHTVEYTLQVVKLAALLNLHQ